MSTGGVGGLHEFDQDPAGVLGVDEIDPRVRSSPSWLVVKQPQTLRPKAGGLGFDVVDRVGDLLDAGSALVEKASDSRLGRDRRQELELGTVFSDDQHRFAYALVLVDLGVPQPEAAGFLVKR